MANIWTVVNPWTCFPCPFRLQKFERCFLCRALIFSAQWGTVEGDLCASRSASSFPTPPRLWHKEVKQHYISCFLFCHFVCVLKLLKKLNPLVGHFAPGEILAFCCWWQTFLYAFKAYILCCWTHEVKTLQRKTECIIFCSMCQREDSIFSIASNRCVVELCATTFF